ncbi:transformer-2 protein homolog beta isoform X2 [Hyalella azteca]|uniref:Transformer-2 protein homolog beta isoform X2 n=1 Tax=Hyalella azteca TaxID=294128 RepID=A0A8B7NUG5_HYAAZ|nr:transformer-2 protein homolog beta isoform X2 [Hyalella azteca]
MSNRRRHVGTRDDPVPNKCLGVFGLSTLTKESQLQDIFDKFGENTVKIVTDAKTQTSRGFGFVYFKSIKHATAAKEACTGMEIDRRRIRVDFSITQRAHTPTPGIYMGRPTIDRYSSYGAGGGGYGGSYSRGGGYRDRDRESRYQRSPPRYRSSYSRDGAGYGGGGGGGGGGGSSSSYRRSSRSDYYGGGGSGRDYEASASGYDRGASNYRSGGGGGSYEQRGEYRHERSYNGSGASAAPYDARSYDRSYERSYERSGYRSRSRSDSRGRYRY